MADIKTIIKAENEESEELLKINLNFSISKIKK